VLGIGRCGLGAGDWGLGVGKWKRILIHSPLSTIRYPLSSIHCPLTMYHRETVKCQLTRYSMNRSQNPVKWLVGFVCCWSILAGCNNTSDPAVKSTGDSAGRITVGTTKKPRTLDPADAYELRSIAIIRNLSDRLYTYDPGDTVIKPQLASALPTISADGLIYTIPLRQGVTFHDGTPFNAAAMVFSLRRFIESKGKPSFLLADRVKSVSVTGEYEIKIELKQPFSAFAAMLAFPGTCAVSPTAYKIVANKFEEKKFVGTGPYRLAEYTADRVTLKPFDRYWGKKPANQGVNIQIFLNNSANLYNSFRTGEIDIAYQSLEPDQVKDLDKSSKQGKWQTIDVEGSVTSYIVLNVRQPPLDNPLVRQAIASFIDRPLINQRILYGQAKPLYSILPSTFTLSQPVFKEAYGDGNMKKAKDLLAQAGFSSQKPAKIEIWYPSSSNEGRLLSSFLRAYALKQLDGMLVFEPNTIEAASFFKRVSEGFYPMVVQNWYPDFLDPDNFVQPFLECPKGDTAKGCKEGGSQAQGSFYYSDRMNKLIAAQGQEQNSVKRQAIYTDIQELLKQDVPLIPLWQTKDYVFVKKGIKGVKIDPLQNLLYSEIEE
jgi:peptide/nickel transport system substrate-binding protein